MFIIRWLTNKSVRQATDLGQQAGKILSAQRDQLSPQAIDAVTRAIRELRAAIDAGAKPEALNNLMDKLEETASKWFKPFPSAAIRENVEMFLTTTAVLLAVFTFFIQHFAIPTGSMQPTLYGIHYRNYAGDSNFQFPGFIGRCFDKWVHGTSYYYWLAPTDGVLTTIEPAQKVLPFVKKQRLLFNNEWHTIWFPPEDLFKGAAFVAEDGFHDPSLGLELKRSYHQGEAILKFKAIVGDHLFVDRLTFNFRHPQRGEIVIFASTGIQGIIPDTYYIKRLIGLEGEKVRIGDDRHVIINGQRLDAATPHFENVYGFDVHNPPRKDEFSGHVNQKVADENSGYGTLSPLFPDGRTEITVGQGRFFTFGDNTMNSHDCRAWGLQGDAYGFPKTKVIGRSSFVFWPVSSRFGWGNR